jgi:hypothetical protein
MPKKKKPAVTKKRNPTDVTVRNVQAANKRIAALEARVTDLIDRITELETHWSR